MPISRLLRHLISGPWQVRAFFPPQARKRIADAIALSEARHGAELCFAVDPCMDPLDVIRGKSGRDRALERFSELRVWDTEGNNGVLLYLLLADRDIEIVADRGADRAVGNEAWESICRKIEAGLASGKREEAVIEGIALITEELSKHFPRLADDRNELPNDFSG